MVPQQRELQRLVPYFLTTGPVAVGAGLTVPVTVNIPGDADMEVRYINAAATSPLASFVLRDSGTRLELMNRAVNLALITGNGNQPFVLPAPALFARNSNIEVILTDASGAPNSIEVCFVGFLIYPGAAMQ